MTDADRTGTEDQPDSRSVLMVLYFFPPLGGVSMSRNVRNVQYLPQHGWTPVVLTPKEAGYHLKDHVSLALIREGTRVIRTSSLEAGHLRSGAVRLLGRLRSIGRRDLGGAAGTSPGGPGPAHGPPNRRPAALTGVPSVLRRLLFFPDDQVGWLPFAVIAALRAHRRTPFDAIYSTSSPVTSHLVAAIVKQRTGLPWIAEFRDPWLGNALANPLPWLHRRLQVKLERWIVGSADRVVGLSPGITHLYRTRYPDAPAMVTITSGYDRGEARKRLPPRDDGRFRIVYTGTLDRPRELATFLEGLDRALARRPDLRERLEIAFYGVVSDTCREVVDRYAARGLGETLQFHGFVPRPDALAALASADAALILLGTGPGMGLFVGGKLFDYIGQDLQILAMLPRGDSRAILEGLRWGVVSDPEADDVARAIELLVSLPPPGGRADPEGKYDRAALAGQLARSLDDVVAVHRRHASITGTSPQP